MLSTLQHKHYNDIMRSSTYSVYFIFKGNIMSNFLQMGGKKDDAKSEEKKKKKKKNKDKDKDKERSKEERKKEKALKKQEKKLKKVIYYFWKMNTCKQNLLASK